MIKLKILQQLQMLGLEEQFRIHWLDKMSQDLWQMSYSLIVLSGCILKQQFDILLNEHMCLLAAS